MLDHRSFLNRGKNYFIFVNILRQRVLQRVLFCSQVITRFVLKKVVAATFRLYAR